MYVQQCPNALTGTHCYCCNASRNRNVPYHNVCHVQTLPQCVQCPDSATLSCLTLQRLPLSVPQLVSASPSATEDGGLVLGSRHSSVYVVDARTGTLLNILPADAATLVSGSHSGTVHATSAAGVHILLHDTI